MSDPWDEGQHPCEVVGHLMSVRIRLQDRFAEGHPFLDSARGDQGGGDEILTSRFLEVTHGFFRLPDL